MAQTPIPSSSLVFKTREFYITNTDPNVAKGSTLTFEDLDKTLLYLSQSISSSVGSSGIYDSAFPPGTLTPQAVGGIDEDTDVSSLEGKTFSEMFDLLLFPALPPAASGFGFSSTVNPSSVQQVGTTASVILTSTFNQGSWVVANQSNRNYYGAATNYYFTSGSTTIDNNTTNIYTFNNYRVLLGSNNFPTAVSHSTGQQPVFSSGAPYSSPIPSGSLTDNSNSFTGVYPYFYGYADTVITNGTFITQSGITTSVTAETNPKLVPYNFALKYLYFAYPKSYGVLTEAKNGSGLNVLPTLQLNDVTISHPLGYWSNIDYYIYIGSITNEILGVTTVNNETWTFQT
jgi:hypothetical protein